MLVQRVIAVAGHTTFVAHGIGGAVLFQGTCMFQHRCSICLENHKMISCPSADGQGVSSRAVGITPSSCS